MDLKDKIKKNTGERAFDKKIDTDNLCSNIMRLFMQGAPKKKISDNVMYEWLRTCTYISMNNLLMSYLEYLKIAVEEGYSQEEILGHFQIELKEAWNILATSKLGLTAFTKTDIEQILQSSTPRQFINKSVMHTKI